MQYLQVHPDNPQRRLVSQAVEIVRRGGVIAYPTDSSYALGCHIGDKDAMERIRRLRQLDEKHDFTLVCRDLSEISTYARIDNQAYRLLKMLTPGPYTFILPASREVPRRLQNPKRKTIGLRVPDHPVVHLLLELLDEPIMSVTLIEPGADLPLSDPEEIRERLGKHLDAVLDSGFCGFEPTTVIDLTDEVPALVRQGKGDASFLSQ
ncbi:MAG: threonylcarbamoyl-AMP synthase [Chromatiales bacterium]|jgi:tRNA threonylcarbamoyl adenosine modification protein (Sua5/YciO/YrdC/YwlC family)|nr:threonylcarbamoyl-AMP synthase [Chromatiales bacterium]